MLEVGEMVRSRDGYRGIGADGGSPEGDWSPADGAAAGWAPWRRAAVERQPEARGCCGCCVKLEALSREAGVEIYRLDRGGSGHGWPRARQVRIVTASLWRRCCAAKRHIGELSMEIELLRERARAAEQRLPLAMRRSRR